jgi:hypothetical protein
MHTFMTVLGALMALAGCAKPTPSNTTAVVQPTTAGFPLISDSEFSATCGDLQVNAKAKPGENTVFAVMQHAAQGPTSCTIEIGGFLQEIQVERGQGYQCQKDRRPDPCVPGLPVFSPEDPSAGLQMPDSEPPQ